MTIFVYVRQTKSFYHGLMQFNYNQQYKKTINHKSNPVKADKNLYFHENDIHK